MGDSLDEGATNACFRVGEATRPPAQPLRGNWNCCRIEKSEVLLFHFSSRPNYDLKRGLAKPI